MLKLLASSINYGIDRKSAALITYKVGVGSVMRGKYKEWPVMKDKLLEANVPVWFVYYCENISYLFPKAHVIQEMRLLYQYMWLMEHNV